VRWQTAYSLPFKETEQHDTWTLCTVHHDPDWINGIFNKNVLLSSEENDSDGTGYPKYIYDSLDRLVKIDYGD
jgi:hypothetical protein